VDDHRNVPLFRGRRADVVPGAVHVGQTVERTVPVAVLSGAKRAGPVVLHVPAVHPGAVPVGLHSRNAQILQPGSERHPPELGPRDAGQHAPVSLPAQLLYQRHRAVLELRHQTFYSPDDLAGDAGGPDRGIPETGTGC